MGIITQTLTPAQITAAQNNASSIGSSANAGIIKSNNFTFFAAFDGTRNNRKRNWGQVLQNHIGIIF